MRHLAQGRIRDERGAALISALLATVLMLGLGFALLSIVDTQANQSGQERTRDRGFNLSESVLTSEAFVLGRNWPAVMPAPNPACGAPGAGFMDTIRQNTGIGDAVARLRNNLDASYTDAAYDGAVWQVNICDDDGTSVWSDTLLARSTYDQNSNKKLWVRAQATVQSKTRVVAGLVQVNETSALDPRFGLVTGSLAQDLASTVGTVSNAPVAGGVIGKLLQSSPQVQEDPGAGLAPPKSGVTGVRCGLLDRVNLAKTCISGALAATSTIPLIDTLVTNKRLEQFPSASSSPPGTAGQLRTKAKTPPGTYIPTSSGGPRASAPNCTGLPASNPKAVVFIEQIGNGDEYCVLRVERSVQYQALVIGKGRVIIRGSGSITPYTTDGDNLFTGVIYALNLQSTEATPPTRELVRVDNGARIRGAVHADGKYSQVSLIPPPFSTNALLDALLCPALCVLKPLLTGLGVDDLLDRLVSGGGCILFVCLPAIDPNTIITKITGQLTGYGSAIHSDVAIAGALKVYGTSGVVSGTFRDLQAR